MDANPPPSLTSPPWSGRTKRAVALVAIGFVFFLTLQLLQAWTIIIVAAIIAYLLNPVVNFIERRALFAIGHGGLRRSLAVVLAFVLVILGFALVAVLIIPPLVTQTEDFIEEAPDLADSVERELQDVLNRPITLGSETIILWDELTQAFEQDSESPSNFDTVSAIQQVARAISAPALKIGTLAISLTFNIFFMIVIMFYLLKDGSRFIDNLDDITPVEYQGDVRRLIYELSRIWDAYLRGQILLGFIIGVTTTIACTMLGLPQPLVLGLLAGLLEVVPNIGPIISSIPAILFALISTSTTVPGLEGLPYALIVAATYTVIQQGEALFLVPRVMGRNLELHPVVILIAVISGAAVAGILGIVLAAPTVATLRLLATYVWGKLLDFDPFARMPSVDMPARRQSEPSLSSTRPRALTGQIVPEQSGEIIDDYDFDYPEH
jgi:predicted PurR-regulated permease PerM